jgi:hypothetical protein
MSTTMSSQAVSFVNVEQVSSVSPSSGAEVMSVVLTHYSHIQGCCLSQRRACEEQSLSHQNSCCLSLALPSGIFWYSDESGCKRKRLGMGGLDSSGSG